MQGSPRVYGTFRKFRVLSSAPRRSAHRVWAGGGPLRRGSRDGRFMAEDTIERPVLNAHGAKRLPSVEVDSYNLEIKDADGFVGDKASRSAFREMLEKWREPLRKLGADPLGDASELIDKKTLDKLLAEGDPEAAGVIHSAVEDFAQTLAGVIKRFLKDPSWRGTQCIVVGGGFRAKPRGRARARTHRGAAEVRRSRARDGAHRQSPRRGRPDRRSAPDALLDARRVRRPARCRYRRDEYPRRHRGDAGSRRPRTCPRRASSNPSCGGTGTRRPSATRRWTVSSKCSMI